jgi:hypothetical protein
VKAAVRTRYGAPEVLRIREVEQPLKCVHCVKRETAGVPAAEGLAETHQDEQPAEYDQLPA